LRREIVVRGQACGGRFALEGRVRGICGRFGWSHASLSLYNIYIHI